MIHSEAGPQAAASPGRDSAQRVSEPGELQTTDPNSEVDLRLNFIVRTWHLFSIMRRRTGMVGSCAVTSMKAFDSRTSEVQL
eukprot:765110-Hanusia_phi.AAC.2